MPTRVPRFCPRCRAAFRAARCPACEARRKGEIDARRGSASERGYGSAWADTRAEHLRHEPWCQAPGCGAKGQHVDHRIPRRQGGTDDPSNLQTLCASCHSAKTARQDGGFGNRRSA